MEEGNPTAFAYRDYRIVTTSGLPIALAFPHRPTLPTRLKKARITAKIRHLTLSYLHMNLHRYSVCRPAGILSAQPQTATYNKP